MNSTPEQTRVMVDEVLSGNNQAFRGIIDANERLVRQIVYRILPNDADREDVCQDVFLKVYQSLATFQFNSKLSTWIGRIAYNTALNHLEKKKVPLVADSVDEETTADQWPDITDITEDFAESRDLSIKLAGEIDELPVMYGTILSLFHLQDMQYGEIADILSLPIGTVKNYLFRARRMLRERLMQKFTAEGLCL